MDRMTDIEHYLKDNGTLTYSNVGVSMMPLLRQGKDLFTVKRKDSRRCKAGDVVLYRRPPNKYVLHRVIEVRQNDYVILGDNCINKEYGISDKDIIGIMTGYVRGAKAHTVSDRSYRVYTWVIMHTIPLRTAVKRLVVLPKRVLKRLLRR